MRYIFLYTKRYSYTEFPVSDDKPFSCICFGIVFSIVYIGVASNFYAHLASLDKAVGGNCSLTYSTELEPNLQQFCENAISWKVCAILGIVLSGVLHLVLACVTNYFMCYQYIVPNTTSSRGLICQNLWSVYDFLTNLAAVAIFFILLATDAHHFEIGNSTAFKTAALIYLIVSGIEAVAVLLLSGLLLICGVWALCWATIGCLGN